MNLKLHPNKALSNNQLGDLATNNGKYFIRNFHNMGDMDGISFVSAGGFTFFCKDKHLVDVWFREDQTKKIPKFYLENKESYLYFTEIDGKYYSVEHPSLTQALDTKNLILKENGFRSYHGGCYEKEDGLAFSTIDRKYFPKEKGVITKDTKTLEYQRICYGTRSGDYYRFSTLASPQNRWDHAPYINAIHFPENINERRIGVEFEFGESYDLFRPFVQSEFLFKWESVRDGSLDAIPQGIEFVSIPFKVSEINEINKFLNFCGQNGAEIYKQCGFHVHIGAQDYNFMDISALVSLCKNVEKDMFTLGGTHRMDNKYCKTLDAKFKGFQEVVSPKDKKKAGDKLYSDQNANFETRHKETKYVDGERNNFRGARYYWFNIDRFYHKREQPEQKTVEFRNHIATFDGSFQDFSLLCYYITEYAKNHSKKTCQNSTLYDVVKTSHIKHRKQLTQYLNSKLK